MHEKPIIKVYGERNTGTNYLQQLMLLNYDACFLSGTVPEWLQKISPWMEIPRDFYFRLTYHRNLGWKHSSAPNAETVAHFANPDRLVFVTITKSPYSWLLSMYRRPHHHWHKKETLTEFLLRPWKTVGRENHALPYKNAIELWNEKNRSYVHLNHYASCINLRYEELLAEPSKVLHAMSDRFGLVFKNSTLVNVDQSTKGDSQTYDDYREYYLNERWRDKLDPAALDIINVHLDRELVKTLGYSIIY